MNIKEMKMQAKEMEAENEFFRQQCLQEEIRARYQKAIHDKMFYYIEWNKLKEDYNSLLDEQMSRMQEVQQSVVPSDAVLNEAASELQEELDEIKEEAKIVTL